MTRRRWWGLLALVVVVWAVVAGFLLVGAALDLRAGKDQAQEARDRLDAEAVGDGSVLPDLRGARSRFRSAASATESPFLMPIRLLPVLGRQVRSINALADAAAEVTDAGTDALEQAKVTLAGDASTAPARLKQVRELSETVGKAARRVRRIEDLGPRSALLPPVRDAHNELAAKLSDVRRALDDASGGARAAVQLLTGPRRYLLVAANPAEMRAGSGMWLSGGVLTTSDGNLDLGDMGPLYDIADPPNGAVAVRDPDVADRWEELWHPNWDWRGLMTSPRVPASAELGLRMWEAGGQDPVEGVLIVDPVAIASVVRAIGPVDALGRRFGPEAVVPYLMNEQYQQPNAERRRAGLDVLADAVFDALNERDWSPADLAAQLGKAIRGRHLMAWSRDELEQRAWTSAGMAGDLSSRSLLVSVLNRGGNKLDWFLEGDARLSSRRAGTDRLVELRLRLTNTVPRGQPQYVAGPPFRQSWEPGLYVGVVAVTLPAAAGEATIDPGPAVTEGRDGRARVIAAEVTVRPGESRDVTVRFRLPERDRWIDVEPSGRVPALRWQHAGNRWQDSARRKAKL